MSPQWLSDWWIVGCSDSDAYTTLQAASLAIHRVSVLTLPARVPVASTDCRTTQQRETRVTHGWLI